MWQTETGDPHHAAARAHAQTGTPTGRFGVDPVVLRERPPCAPTSGKLCIKKRGPA